MGGGGQRTLENRKIKQSKSYQLCFCHITVESFPGETRASMPHCLPQLPASCSDLSPSSSSIKHLQAPLCITQKCYHTACLLDLVSQAPHMTHSPRLDSCIGPQEVFGELSTPMQKEPVAHL